MIPQKRAGLHVIVGPMFSGKSAELIHWLKLHKAQGAPVAAFTHGLSVQQGEGFIKSRNGETFPARAIRRVMHLEPPLDAFRPGWVLAFDEFQFFTPEDANIVIELAKDHYVLVAGLDTDFRREPFESMQVLMSKGKDLPCYTETWVKAVCHKCGQHNAVYTQRLINGEPAPHDSPLILPGDQGLYEARCKACYEPPAPDRVHEWGCTTTTSGLVVYICERCGKSHAYPIDQAPSDLVLTREPGPQVPE